MYGLGQRVCPEERSVNHYWPLVSTSLVHQQKRQDQDLNFSPRIRTDTTFKLVLSHPLSALFDTLAYKLVAHSYVPCVCSRPSHGLGGSSSIYHREIRGRCQPSLCGICGGQRSTGVIIFSKYFSFPLSVRFNKCSIFFRFLLIPCSLRNRQHRKMTH